MAKKTIFEKLGLSEKTAEVKAEEEVKKDQMVESLNQKEKQNLEKSGESDISKEKSDLQVEEKGGLQADLEIQEQKKDSNQEILSKTEIDSILQKETEIDFEHLEIEDLLKKEDEKENAHSLEEKAIDIQKSLSQTLSSLEMDTESLLKTEDLEQNSSLEKTKEALSEMKNWSDEEEKIEQGLIFEESKTVENISYENIKECEDIDKENIDTGELLSKDEVLESEGGVIVDNIQVDNIQLEDKDTIQSVADVYTKSQMEIDKLKTIFMVDQFQKTLPENLPVDVKRTSVTNIINVSNMDLDNLLNDAYKRMDALNQVLEQSAQKTDDIISAKQIDIEKLEQEIGKLQQAIKERKRFQDEQTSIIEYEVQRIVGIVDFIKPQK